METTVDDSLEELAAAAHAHRLERPRGSVGFPKSVQLIAFMMIALGAFDLYRMLLSFIVGELQVRAGALGLLSALACFDAAGSAGSSARS